MAFQEKYLWSFRSKTYEILKTLINKQKYRLMFVLEGNSMSAPCSNRVTRIDKKTLLETR